MMEPRYQTLQTIYDIVKHDARPLHYWCSPREIIVRQPRGWDVVEKHLRELVEEGLAESRLLGAYVFRITMEGLEMAKAASSKPSFT